MMTMFLHSHEFQIGNVFDCRRRCGHRHRIVRDWNELNVQRILFDAAK